MGFIETQLRQIGLTNNEIRIYLACLALGNSRASEISKRAGVYRTLTYDILGDLIKKGLVSYVNRENRKYYHATSPESLMIYVEQKQRKINEQKETVKALIKEIANIEKVKKEKYPIETFSGYGGFKVLFEDILKKSKRFFVIGYRSDSKYIAKPYFVSWQRRRIQKQIKRNVIVQEKDKELILRYPEYTKLRTLPDSFALLNPIIIYNNKVILFVPFEDDYVAVKITNANVFKTYKTHFESFWKFAEVEK